MHLRLKKPGGVIAAALVVSIVVGVVVVPLVRAARAAGAQPVGFGLRLELMTGSNTAALLNGAQIMRTDWIAQDVHWKDIEPEPGAYNWEKLDGAILATRPYGFRILLTVAGTPDWARPAGADLTLDGPPADYAAYASFLLVLAKRYEGVVGAYEIWPESNLRSRWSSPDGVSPENYTEFLRQASAAVHASDPMSIVVAGSLAPTGSNDGVNVIDDLAFYQRMYTAGAAPYFDVLGVRVDGHNNPPADTPESSSVTTTTFKGHTSFYYRHYEAVHEIMLANGDASKTLWITSAGWASAAQPLPGMEYAADVNEQQQATYLAEALVQAQSQPYIGAIIINNFNISTVPNSPPQLAPYSLIRADWSARPAFITLAQLRQGDVLTQPVAAAPEARPVYVLPNWHPRLRYHFETGQP